MGINNDLKDRRQLWDEVLAGIRGIVNEAEQNPVNSNYRFFAWKTGRYDWKCKGIRVEGSIRTPPSAGRKPYFIAKTAAEARDKMPGLLVKPKALEEQRAAQVAASRAATMANDLVVSSLRSRLEAAGYVITRATDYTLTVELSVGELTFNHYDGHWNVKFLLVANMQNESGMLGLADILSGRKTKCE